MIYPNTITKDIFLFFVCFTIYYLPYHLLSFAPRNVSIKIISYFIMVTSDTLYKNCKHLNWIYILSYIELKKNNKKIGKPDLNLHLLIININSFSEPNRYKKTFCGERERACKNWFQNFIIFSVSLHCVKEWLIHLSSFLRGKKCVWDMDTKTKLLCIYATKLNSEVL